MSAAGASWYKGTGMPPRHCAANIAQYSRGQLLPMMARLMPRLKPSAARPQANARTSTTSSAQLVLCQMPKCFSRNAGLSGRTCACLKRSCGKVCFPGLCVVSSIVPPFCLLISAPCAKHCQVDRTYANAIRTDGFLSCRRRKSLGTSCLTWVERSGGLSRNLSQTAPHQHGAGDVVALDACFTTLATPDVRQLLCLTVKLPNLPAQATRISCRRRTIPSQAIGDFEIVHASSRPMMPPYQLRLEHVRGFSLDVAADRKLTMLEAAATVSPSRS